MKCKRKFFRLLAVLIIGLFAIGFSIKSADNAVNPAMAHFVPACESFRHHWYIGTECISSNYGQKSDPLAYLFQIIFILFFISPPLIVILLFLIWKELKERNDKMK